MTRPPAMPDEDYEAIEAAVMDTARGRWFLAEFARRNRTADTSLLLAAIEQLKGMLAASEKNAPPKPHEPAAEDERATSATSELFALENLTQRRSELPLPSVPNDVAWLEDQTAEEPKFAPPNVFEFDDEDLTLPPPVAYQAPEPAPLPRSTAQSSMLVAALAQAEQTATELSEPVATAAPPMTTSPPAADPAELDALSFEEKSVYFA